MAGVACDKITLGQLNRPLQGRSPCMDTIFGIHPQLHSDADAQDRRSYLHPMVRRLNRFST